MSSKARRLEGKVAVVTASTDGLVYTPFADKNCGVVSATVSD